MDLGVLKDMGHVAYAGLSGTDYVFTVSDSTPPTILTFLPQNSSASALIDTDIVLTFSEYVQAGTGAITITPTGGTGENEVLTIPIGDAQAHSELPHAMSPLSMPWLQVTVATTQVSPDGLGIVTINPTADIVSTGTKTFTVTCGNTILRDATNRQFAGLLCIPHTVLTAMRRTQCSRAFQMS